MPEDPIHDPLVRDDGDDPHLCAAGTEMRPTSKIFLNRRAQEARRAWEK